MVLQVAAKMIKQDLWHRFEQKPNGDLTVESNNQDVSFRRLYRHFHSVIQGRFTLGEIKIMTPRRG
jgi:hypothetical protein